MTKNIREGFKHYYNNISIRRLIATKIILFSIVVIIIFLTILFCYQRNRRKIEDIVNNQVGLSIKVSSIFNSMNNALFLSIFRMYNKNYWYAELEFNNYMSYAEITLNKIIRDISKSNDLDMYYFKKDLVDVKISMRNLKVYFLNNIKMNRDLYFKKQEVYLFKDVFEEKVNNLEKYISKRSIMIDKNKGNVFFLNQVFEDLSILRRKINRLFLVIEDDLEKILSGKAKEEIKSQDIFSDMDFILDGIYKEIPGKREDLDEIKDILSSTKTISYENIQIAKKINEVQEDLIFYYSILDLLNSTTVLQFQYMADKAMDRLNKYQYCLIIVLVICFIFIGFTIFLLFIIMKKRVIRPLSILDLAIEQTGKGTGDVTLPIYTNDEFGRLANRFHEMAFSIKVREKSLLSKNIEIEKRKKQLEILKDYVEGIIQTSPNVIVTFDKNRRIVLVNRKAEELFNLDCNSLKDCKISDVDKKYVKYEDVIEDVINQKQYKTLYNKRMSIYDDKVFNIYIYPLANRVGGGAVFEAEDVTERVELQNKLVEAHRMETMGLLAGGFAHDFNNLLTGIIGNLELAKMSKRRDVMISHLTIAKDISEKASQLINQILLFSKSGVKTVKKINVSKTIDNVIGIASHSMRKNIKIVKNIKNKDLTIYGDFSQIAQIFLNLIINAIDAIGDKEDGKIVISAEMYRITESEKTKYNLIDKGDYLFFTCEDNGIGINEEIRKRIFDPFFTTKDRGSKKGTGLRLSIVYGIVKSHKGAIDVKSKEGAGTKMEVLIPAGKEKSFREARKSIIKGSGLVLLVDDEKIVRKVGEKMLEHLGYEVLTANDGKECIDILKNKENINLIILDLVMPGLDGIKTLKAFKKMGLKKSVIISSGHITLDMAYLREYDYIRGILKKPFNIEDLSFKVSKVIKEYSE